LEPEHLETLRQLADASRALPRHKREFHLLGKSFGTSGTQTVMWDGGSLEVFGQDIYDLVSAGLLRQTAAWVGGQMEFMVPPETYDHLADLEAQAPLARVEEHIATYIQAEEFRERYPAAYQRWADAAVVLWGPDGPEQLSTIGHMTREAMQEFAAALIARHAVEGADADTAKTINRLRSVIDHHRERLGERDRLLLDALVTYWSAVNGIDQQLEHAGQKAGDPLTWEHARRAVFQTAIVMTEVDRALEP
jgi:hypothetical protein